jgi:hypothetical protein
MRLHGHQNGLQRRYICLSQSPFLFTVNVAKEPYYSLFKLTPSYNINPIGVISLFGCYCLSLTTMDAVLATTVAGGRAQIQLNIEVNKSMLISTLI